MYTSVFVRPNNSLTQFYSDNYICLNRVFSSSKVLFSSGEFSVGTMIVKSDTDDCEHSDKPVLNFT